MKNIHINNNISISAINNVNYQYKNGYYYYFILHK